MSASPLAAPDAATSSDPIGEAAHWEMLVETLGVLPALGARLGEITEHLDDLERERAALFRQRDGLELARVHRRQEELLTLDSELRGQLDAARQRAASAVRVLTACDDVATSPVHEAFVALRDRIAEDSRPIDGATGADLHRAALEARARLHEHRTSVLEPKLRELAVLVEQASTMEIAETDVFRRLLADRLFLGEPLRDAQHRLDNDIYQLRAVIEARDYERRLEDARDARQQINELLGSMDSHALEHLPALLTRVLAAPHEEEPALDRRILAAIARAPVEDAAKLNAWLAIAALTAKSSSAIDGLMRVLGELPELGRAAQREAAATEIALTFGCENEEPLLLLPLVEQAVTVAPQWAQPFFGTFFGETKNRLIDARWLLIRPDAPSAEEVSAFVAQLPPMQQAAVLWWATSRHDIELRPAADPFEIWLEEGVRVPDLSSLIREAGRRGAAARYPMNALVATVAIGTGRPDEDGGAIASLSPERLGAAAEFLQRAASSGIERARRELGAEDAASEAGKQLDSLLDPSPQEALHLRREALRDWYSRMSHAGGGKLSVKAMSIPWTSLMTALKSRLEPLFPDARELPSPADVSQLATEIGAQSNKIATSADVVRWGRRQWDGLVEELQDLVRDIGASMQELEQWQRCGSRVLRAWLESAVPRVTALRARLRSSETRAVALTELELVTPRDLLGVTVEGYSPEAKRFLQSRCENIRRLLIKETSAEEPAAALSDGLQALRAEGPVGVAAATLLDRLARSDWPADPPVPYTSEREIVTSLLAAGRSRYVLARLLCAPEPKWREAAGEDVLLQLAQRDGLDAAIDHYLRTKRFDLACAALVDLPEATRPAARARIDAEATVARREVQELAQEFMRDLLVKERDLWPGRDHPELVARLADVLGRVDAFLGELARVEPEHLWPRFEALEAESTGLLNECGRCRDEVQSRVRSRLFEALDAGFRGQSTTDAPLLGRMMHLAATADLGAVVKVLELLDLAPDAPERGSVPFPAIPQPPPMPATAVSAPPRELIPAQELDLNDLSLFSRSVLLQGDGPSPDYEPPTSPASAEIQQRALAAAALYARRDPVWSVWLGHWAVAVGYRLAAVGALRQAEDHARDGLRLLTRVDIDSADAAAAREALMLWLVAALERMPTPFHTLAPDWSRIRGDAAERTVTEYVRHFFARGAVDLLADIMAEAVAMGGIAARLVLSAVDRLGEALTLRVCRALVEASPPGPPSTLLRRAATASVVLRAPLQETLTSGFSRDPDAWGQSANDQPFFAQLVAAGVTEAAATTLVEAFRALARSRLASREGAKLLVRMLTKTVYLSSASRGATDLVLELHYKAKGQIVPLRDLRVRATLKHSALRFANGGSQTEIVVAALRPNEPAEFTLALRGQGASIEPGKLVLEARDSTGGAREIGRGNNLVFEVQPEYPAMLRGLATPYHTGKMIRDLRSIKGRDDTVQEILQYLQGARGANFVTICGARRIGKSTVLEKFRQQPSVRARFVSVRADLDYDLRPTAVAFLLRLARKIREEADDTRVKSVPVPESLPPDEPHEAFGRYLLQVSESLGADRRLLLLIDEFQLLRRAIEASERRGLTEPCNGLPRAIEGWIRHWIQEFPVAFVCAGTTREIMRVQRDPKERIFQLGRTVFLEELHEKPARDLIKEPAELEHGPMYDDITGPATETLLRQTERHPYLLSYVCDEVWQRMHREERRVVTQGIVEQAISSIIGENHVFSPLLPPDLTRPQKVVLWALSKAMLIGSGTATEREVVEQLTAAEYDDLATGDDVRKVMSDFADDIIARDAARDRFRLRPRMLARYIVAKEQEFLS